MRILRHVFLKTYKLPDLFPFSKYLRHAQNNHINHVIEVEMSTWIILLLLGWVMVEVSDLLQDHFEIEEHVAIVSAFLMISWLAVALHLAIICTFFGRLTSYLTASDDVGGSKCSRLAKLEKIAAFEASVQDQDEPTDVIAIVQIMQDVREAERACKIKHHHCFLTKHDTGFQLVAILLRKLLSRLRTSNPGGAESQVSRGHLVAMDDIELGQNPIEAPSFQVNRCLSQAGSNFQPPPCNTDRIRIPFFSRKAWHFIVMSTLMLNGFYFALFCQSIMYQLGKIADQFGLAVAIFIPLPLIVNMMIFQPRILRDFILVSSIHRVDDTAMGDAIDHFTKAIGGRAEFVQRVNDHLKCSGQTLEHIRGALEALGVMGAGVVNVDGFRHLIGKFGFKLSLFQFHSVARLLFEVRGTQVDYKLVLKWLSLPVGRTESSGSWREGDDRTNGSRSVLYRSSTISPSSSRDYALFLHQTPYLDVNPVLRYTKPSVLRALYSLNYSLDDNELRQENTYHYVRM